MVKQDREKSGCDPFSISSLGKLFYIFFVEIACICNGSKFLVEYKMS